MSTPTVVIHHDADLLAKAVAARLVTKLIDAQAARGHASVVLTGGGVGTAVLRETATNPARDAVDWRRVDVWWGDERFLPTGDPERNETAARQALLDHVGVDPHRVHPMPAAGDRAGADADPAAGARAYADALRAAALRAAAARSGDEGPVPSFDVLLLGLGPDTHVASLFPGMPALAERDRPVVAVHDAPKPPPTRITMTLPTIRAAHEVWIIAAGAQKAAAVRDAALSADPARVPGAGARGRDRTLFLLDRAAAADLPARTRGLLDRPDAATTSGETWSAH